MGFDLQNNTVVLQYRQVLHSTFLQLQENNLWTPSPFPTLYYLRFLKYFKTEQE